MAGKKLTALEMPEEDEVPIPVDPGSASTVVTAPVAAPMTAPSKAILLAASLSPVANSSPLEVTVAHYTPTSIPLPPIPAAPARRVMVQLSIKAPVDLVERLEAMTNATRAQKQAVIAAALDAYMKGHGY